MPVSWAIHILATVGPTTEYDRRNGAAVALAPMSAENAIESSNFFMAASLSMSAANFERSISQSASDPFPLMQIGAAFFSRSVRFAAITLLQAVLRRHLGCVIVK